MRKIRIPYVGALDVLDLSSVGYLLETKAQRESLDEINWSDYPYKPIVAFEVARTDKNLYICYFVKGHSLKATYAFDDSPVHKDSCVEFFMKRVDEEGYMNFEFNCIGTCSAARRLSREESCSLSEEEYATIRRHSTVRGNSFQEKRGIFSWELIVAIPLELMGLDPANLPEKILANFYKCADETANPHFVSWNPILTATPDFHRPEFFGELYF